MAKTNPPKNSATRGTRQKTSVRSCKCRDLSDKFQPDKHCQMVLEVATPEWIPERIRRQVEDSLRGFSGEMAYEIVNNLIDLWTFGVRRFTNIKHVDCLLNSLYNRILYCARQRGIEFRGYL